MMDKYTPGPWEVVALNGFGPFAIRMTTPVGAKHPTHYGVGQVGTQENARLISAAPDMLDALYKAAAELKMAGIDSVGLPAIRAAIAKAEGRALPLNAEGGDK
jgi:hypothetical protein